MTFNFLSTSANTLKFIGYSDGVNGIEFQQSGSTLQFALLSATSNGNQIITQANWNLDKMDGTGPSGITLDATKIQILVIDFQALYAGRVRIGFDIDGIVFYAHEFKHANVISTPFFQSANLPVRAGMTCTGTVSTTMNYLCAAVISEGGTDGISERSFGVEGNVTAGNGVRTHILSIRPKTTFNSIVNRIGFSFDSLNILNQSTNPILWELCLGQAISGTTTFNDVNTTYSGFAFNTLGTISGSPAVVIASGYVGPATGSGVNVRQILNRYPISLDASGAVRALGTLTVLVTAFTGTAVCRCSLNWKEIR